MTTTQFYLMFGREIPDDKYLDSIKDEYIDEKWRPSQSLYSKKSRNNQVKWIGVGAYAIKDEKAITLEDIEGEYSSFCDPSPSTEIELLHPSKDIEFEIYESGLNINQNKTISNSNLFAYVVQITQKEINKIEKKVIWSSRVDSLDSSSIDIINLNVKTLIQDDYRNQKQLVLINEAITDKGFEPLEITEGEFDKNLLKIRVAVDVNCSSKDYIDENGLSILIGATYNGKVLDHDEKLEDEKNESEWSTDQFPPSVFIVEVDKDEKIVVLNDEYYQ